MRDLQKLLSRRIKAARKKKGITQTELSVKSKVSYATTLDLENGRGNPTIKKIIDLERVLGPLLS